MRKIVMNDNCCMRPLVFSAALFMVLASSMVNAESGKPPPNILFMVMDDVSIDQMKVFADPAKTLAIDLYSGSQKCQSINQLLANAWPV